MLRIVTGPFHPTLEQALVEDVRSLKTADPYAPLAIVVPSSTLAAWLKRFLTVESHCPLLNVHILTFHQLALRLRDDLVRAGRTLPRLQLVDDFYFEQLVRQVVQRKIPGLAPLERLPGSPGTWKGLWATVRDLKDAALSPDTALHAVAEGLFEEDDRTWLQALFTLYAATLESGRSLEVGSPDDLAASLCSDLAASSFLQHLAHICYFGFYDLSQVQLSLFEAVTSLRPATVYFPLESKPAYRFAHRFFDRHLLPLAPGSYEQDAGGDHRDTRQPVELSIFSVVGADEELATVCREILTLVEVNGYGFDEIGVVARSLEPYQYRLQALFDRHLIPFTSTAGRPILREPLAKVLLRLASLPLNEYDQAAVLDVLASPFYRTDSTAQPRRELRPDLWRRIVSTLGITKGESEWERLAPSAAAPILQDVQDNERENAQSPLRPYDLEQAGALWSLISRLIDDCRLLPVQGTISRLTDAFLGLVETHFEIPGWMDSAAEAPSPGLSVGGLLRETLERLRLLDPLCGDFSWEEWYGLLSLILEETAMPIERDQHRGVQVLDAMTARGLRFRALFLIGMNEQSFPRYVREDPFLRDRQRAVLESTLGFKIDEKLAGHDEERLLFALLCRAATHRLCLTYQRVDEGGRAMVPSAFVGAALRDERFIPKPEIVVPRRLTARIAAQPAMQEVLPAQDLALGCLLHEQSASPILEALGKDVRLLEGGQAAQVLQERESPELGPFDGVLASGTVDLPALEKQGISSTSLERYATCPFQYFSENVLQLEPVRPRHEMQLPAMTIGTLLHEALRLSYEHLLTLQWPDPSVTELQVRTTVTEVVGRVFAGHAAARGTGHALLWAMAQEQVVLLIAAAVESDREDCLSQGFRPYAFEVDAEGSIALGDGLPSLKIHGRLDRVDVQADPPAARIVDYKFKQGSEMQAEDRNLLLSAVRGRRLQPPLYASMTMPSLPAPSQVQLLYLAPRWEHPITRATFEAAALRGNAGAAIVNTLRTLVQGIERREFFILPDSYCECCAFAVACRRNDQATWWRSYRAPQARQLRRLRKQKVTDE